jgi:hypothetical protein
MAGKGKECLITCFRRAGTVTSGGERGTRLSESGSEAYSMTNRGAEVRYNREAVRTAVGITVDAVSASTKILDIFRELANTDGEQLQNNSQRYGANTFRELYPFLRTQNEDALIARYKAELKALEGDDSALSERKAVEEELNKAAAVKQRKIAEQRKFLTRLDRIQNNVREAEKLFSSDGFADSVIEELERDNADEGDDNNGNNRNRRTSEGGLLGDVLNALFGDETGDGDGNEVLSDRPTEAEGSPREQGET